MSEPEKTQTQASAVAAEAKPKRESAQITLSTIGDVGVAASDAISRVGEARKGIAWPAVLAFFLFVYASSAGVAWALARTSLWVGVLAAPLFPAFCATAAFWWRQRWKFRAQDWKFRLKIWQDALESLGHEAANAVNAIRANLTGFRSANPLVSMPGHLEEIEFGARRIDAAVQKAQNPVAWKGSKKKEETTPTPVGEDARSRISL